VILSVLLQAAIQLGVQLYIYHVTRIRLGDSYEACRGYKSLKEGPPVCQDNTALFFVSSFQYLITCACFSMSKPFRASVFTNPVYVVAFVIMAAWQAYMVLRSNDFSNAVMGLVDLPSNFRHFLAIVIVANFVISFFCERVLVQWFCHVWEKRDRAKWESNLMGQIMKLDNQWKDHKEATKVTQISKGSPSGNRLDYL
jgi:magnesium-transporting ATPase (P-type)